MRGRAQPGSRARRPRPPRIAGVVAVVAIATGALGLFVAAVPTLHTRHRAVGPDVAAGLDRLGLSPAVYAAYVTGLLVAFAVLCTTVAVLVVLRRPAERMAWWVALFLVLVGAVNAPTVEAVAWRWPGLTTAASVANLLLVASMVAVLVTFPDGRPWPRWAPAPAGATVAVLVATGWGSLGDDLPDAWFLLLCGAVLAGLAAQVLRYRRASTWEQRQQTKWVVVAVAVAVLCQVAFPVVASLPALTAPGVGALVGELVALTGVTVGFGVLVVAVGIAVLRHRLWDVDVVVNRTVVYGGLTVGLITVYGAVAVGVERVVGSRGDVGGSLLAAAAVAVVFAPARDRLHRGVNRLMYGQRDEPSRVLSDLARRLRTSMGPESVLETIVATVGTALRLPYAALLLHGHDAAAPVAAFGTPVPGAVAIPLVHRDETVGTLVVAPRSRDEPLGPADRALLDDLASQAAAAAAEIRLAEELRRAREQRVLSLEEERRRLRRDLHDGLGPSLASMTLQAELAHDLLERDPSQSAHLLAELTRGLQASTADIRRLVYDLRPPALDDLGLEGALRAFLAGAGASGTLLDLVVAGRGLPALPAAVEVAAYRIVQEAVTNVIRHAGPSSCRVDLGVEGGALVIDVVDDGVGLPAAVRAGVGLRSMRERAAELGGSCTVTGPDRGTRVHVRLPAGPTTEATP